MQDEAWLVALSLSGLSLIAVPWLEPESSTSRKLFVAVISLTRAIYLWWRLAFTLPELELTGAALFAYVFLAIELCLLFASQRLLLSILNYRNRSAEADTNDRWYAGSGGPPSVAILIATYNEELSIIEKTVVGAQLQEYDNFTIWILDDGRRDGLREAAERWGVRYVRRNDNEHAKAGNLNHALEHLDRLGQTPDLIAVLDADFIPRPRFLRRAIALLHDPEVGLVQTPQSHFNADPFQSAFRQLDGWPDVQRFTFAVLLPSRDAEDSAFCCGTSFVARREAIREIGGIPTDAVTEDVLTTVRLRQRGYRTVFLGEVLSTGLAPEGLREFITQRGRWSLGSAQIARLTALAPASSAWRKFLNLEVTLRWGYTSLLRVVVLLVPLAFWYLGWVPFNATATEIIVFAVPNVLLARVFMTWVSKSTHQPILYDASALLAAPTVVRAMFKGLFSKGRQRFVVTTKGASSEHTVVHWGTLSAFGIYLALLVAGMVGFFAQGKAISGDYAYIVAFWSALNVVTIAVALAPCIEGPRRRQEERYTCGEAATIHAPDGNPRQARLTEISLSGARIHAPGVELEPGQVVQLDVQAVGLAAARVVRPCGLASWAVRFELSDQQRIACTAKVFCSDRYVHPPLEGSLARCFAALALKLVR